MTGVNILAQGHGEGTALDRLRISIGASFTADPLALFAPVWSRVLGRDIDFALAPYGQLYQQLLDPGSLLGEASGKASGVAYVLVRWSDITGDAAAELAAEELAAALGARAGMAALTVIICPEKDDQGRGAADERLEALTDEANHIRIVRASDIFSLYGVDDPMDAQAGAAANIPYTMEACAALSAAMMRQALAATRRPIKMVAVDCDNTLWNGVVGEDGLNGLTLDQGRLRLQEQLAAQADHGRIIAVLSKNEADDVDAVFEARADMVLQPRHILARAINWNAKPENLRGIADQFAVGENAIVFLDDNPVEIAAMNAACPAVVSVQMPLKADDIARFAEHFWPFDLPPATREDRQRGAMYRDEAARLEMRKDAPSLDSFLQSLDLRVDIFEARRDLLQRLGQLSQRTNQFNASLQRFSGDELESWASADGRRLWSVSVRDRFGDYGVVGLVGLSMAAADSDVDAAMTVDLFLLSCRALGRGVEHKMAAAIGAAARLAGCEKVRFTYRPGPRNAPAKAFLEGILGHGPEQDRGNSIDAERLAQTVYRPDAQTGAASPAPGEQRQAGGGEAMDDGALWARIASELTTGAAIVEAMETVARRPRPDLSTAYMAPAPGLETDIARVWSQVLSVENIGAQDRFADLGGKSVDLVRIHGGLSRLLGRDIDLTLLFECATISELARRLAAADAPTTAHRASRRAEAMRRARSEHGARLRAARGGPVS